MYCFLDDRYDWNQQKAVSPIPKVCCKRSNKTEWSTISKATDRSRRIAAARSSRSAWGISESTHRMAISVEWPCQKPDWRGGRRRACDRYFINWWVTRCSRSFERTDKFEIGRYELTLVLSSPGFFRAGVINAVSTKDDSSEKNFLHTERPSCYPTKVSVLEVWQYPQAIQFHLPYALPLVSWHVCRHVHIWS